MQFSQSAIAALLLAAATTVSARCAPRPSASSSYSSAATILPSTVETLSPVATPTPTPSSSAAVVPTTLASSTSAAAATTTTPAASSGLTTDEQNALAAHNAARAEVGVSDLTWDESLVSAAQAWADTLGARGPGQLEHGSTGENLYWQSGTSDDALTAASDAWIAEKADYNGEAIPASGDASWMHYSQVIWSTTSKLGMATASDGQGGTYVVARYDPGGNYIGEVPTEATN